MGGGRGHVIVYNWRKLKRIDVNLSPIVSEGAEYRVFHVLGLKNQPVAAGIFSGSPVSLSRREAGKRTWIRCSNTAEITGHCGRWTLPLNEKLMGLPSTWVRTQPLLRYARLSMLSSPGSILTLRHSRPCR